jgi:hypothetical protein
MRQSHGREGAEQPQRTLHADDSLHEQKRGSPTRTQYLHEVQHALTTSAAVAHSSSDVIPVDAADTLWSRGVPRPHGAAHGQRRAVDPGGVSTSSSAHSPSVDAVRRSVTTSAAGRTNTRGDAIRSTLRGRRGACASTTAAAATSSSCCTTYTNSINSAFNTVSLSFCAQRTIHGGQQRRRLVPRPRRIACICPSPLALSRVHHNVAAEHHSQSYRPCNGPQRQEAERQGYANTQGARENDNKTIQQHNTAQYATT